MAGSGAASPEVLADNDHEPIAHSILSDDAFAAALEDVAPHLRAFARGLCKSPTFADDLVQDALLKAWMARGRFCAGTKFKAWIFTILRNVFLSHIRRQKFERGVESTDLDLQTARPAQEGHMAMLEVQEALKHVHHERRQALLLVGAAGMSYEEAAEICGCPVGTIKSRVSRARSELQQILESGTPTMRAPSRPPAASSDAHRRGPVA
jgi:RNA polymerase sigma-70 factor (ECF subfamily)